MLRLRIPLVLAALAAAVSFAGLSDTLPPPFHHPAIGYSGPSADPVARLNARLVNGTAQLAYETRC
jgi:hypothetical protein